ncbi:MAG: Holliday junction branch migration protein RuvA [bacterium TMED6]|mgnify:FL=1|nr:MAG: Holliday junction branch migration protein RuvA [bacterium TMED6]|tara:strand:- start:13977 stop:14564 length:588 start_codon:yes stop_codon:yes gene_type:complete
MIVQITGILKSKSLNELIVDANGIGYLCNISTTTFNLLPEIENQFTILTYLHIMENKHTLYGFMEKEERQLFNLLISVSGIGPKIAIQLLSKTDNKQMSNMIVSGDVKMLSSLPGIGPKTAQRLIVELKDKFTFDNHETIPTDNSFSKNQQDAYNALLTLGYKSVDIQNKIQSLINKNPNATTEELIKNCLKDLK